MAAHRTTPNGIASYTLRGVKQGPYPARITPRRVRVNGYTFDRETLQRVGTRRVNNRTLLSYTITPKDTPCNQ